MVALAACQPQAKMTAPTTVPSLVSQAILPNQSKPPKLRLGNSARPTHYSLRLRIVPAEDTFTGEVEIDLLLRERISVLWLNGTDLVVTRARVLSQKKVVPADPVPGGDDFLGFAFESPLDTGSARLYVSYTGKLSKRDSRGLFSERDGNDWYVTSQFESHYARLAFPCFDEPSFKVPWQLTLEVPRTDRAFSNTPITGELDSENGLKTVAFAETKPLPSYLVALAVGPYEAVPAGKAGSRPTPMGIVAQREKGAQARYAAEVSGPILEQLEEYVGEPYPYEKMDVLSIPVTTMFGAMENPGLVTATQTLVLARREDETIAFKRSYAKVMAHEFAHMWFGDLVTTAWWDDVWLNEALATWMSTRLIEKWKPDWDHGTGPIQTRSFAMEADRLRSARKIRQPILTTDDIVNAFDGITYEKGASVLAMFERWIGEAEFQRGIRHYLKKNAWGTATAQNFLASFEESSSKKIAPAFSTFLDQAGAPLVSVELQCSAGAKPKLSLSQELYTPVGTTASAQQRWQIPICVKYKAGRVRQACTLLTGTTARLELTDAASCPEWILANSGELGYYRASYSQELLSHLLKRGEPELSLPERLGLANDLDALVRAGKLPYAELLRMIPTWAADPNRELVQSAAAIAGSLRETLTPPELRANLARFVSKSFGARAKRLGWLPRADDDPDSRLLRRTVVPLVADAGQDHSLQGDAQQLARRWLDDRSAVDAEMIDAVLSVAAANGDSALFDQLYQQAKKAPERRERIRLLGALGEFREPSKSSASLQLVLSDEFDPRDSIVILYRASRHTETRATAYEFVKQHFEELVTRLPRDAGASLPNIGLLFCDEEHRTDMERFFNGRSTKYTGGPRDLANALERVHLCAALRNAQESSLAAFLKRQ
jgi:alanyl aminopeptidase